MNTDMCDAEQEEYEGQFKKTSNGAYVNCNCSRCTTLRNKEELSKGLVWKPYSEWKGGQIAGWPPGAKGARLVHEELGFEIAINYYRSQLDNKQRCLDIFDAFLNTLKL